MLYNITDTDKTVRLGLGAAMVYAGVVYHPFFAFVALILFLSAATKSCLVYKLLGINHDLEQMHRYLSVLPRYNPEPVLLFSDNGTLLFRNRAAESLLPNLDTYAQLQVEIAADVLIKKGHEAVIRHREGAKTYQLVLQGNSKEHFVMVYGFDITPIIESERALKKLALFDPLTGLANRKQLIMDLQTPKERMLTLIDIKNFGQINGFYGHALGDRFLQVFAQILESLKQSSAIGLYRLQGDVFALLYTPDEAPRIEGFFSERYVQIDDIEFVLQVRMGHALDTKSDLLNMAETALIEAKKRNIASLHYAELGDITARYLNNLEWSKRIKRILSLGAEGELVGYFQPIVNAQTKAVEKYETLARVIYRSKIITPVHFLDSTKQLGLLHQLSMAMLDAILRKAQTNSYEFSLNITTQDLQQPHLKEELLERLRTYGVASSRIVLEILELEDEEVYGYLELLQALKAEGFKLAIDDFGTGYSNFAKLQQIEVDYIKIDGSLIRSIQTNSSHLEVVRTINRFAHSIGAKTIAEFVSDDTIASILSLEQIDYLQGYAFGAPNPNLID